MTKEIVKKAQDVKGQEWYDVMIEESAAILTERGYNIKVELIHLKWELGNRVFKEKGNFERFGYGKKIVETVAGDLNISRTELFYCIQFAEKYPELSTIMDSFGKEESWSSIKRDHLPKSGGDGKDSKHYMTCILDKEKKIIWIKEEYKDYKIKYK